MVNNTSIVIDSKEAEDLIKSLPIFLKFKVNTAIHESGFMLQREVKLSIAGQKDEDRSVDTGRFLNSVNVNNDNDFVSEILSNIPYAGILEEGTSTREARNHFKNSAKRKEPEIVKKISEAIHV